MNEKKYYIAYGSNLSVEQMAQRCPDARIVGQAVLEDWELAFHGCATILPNKGKNTPVLVWEISAGDEKNLDIYEGFPHYYRKENMTVEVVSKDAEPMTVTANRPDSAARALDRVNTPKTSARLATRCRITCGR